MIEPVLLVDDDPATRAILKEVLEYLGHPCLEAGDARTALELLATKDVRAILMDYSMPSGPGERDGLGGQVILKSIEIKKFRSRLILMSAFHRLSWLEAKEHDWRWIKFLRKPFSLEDLKSVLDQVLVEQS